MAGDTTTADYSMLAISIGPVQDFIASARRCQDLWYGSWLLSHLARTIAETIQRHDGDALVFPGKERLDDKVHVANKIVARVPSDRVQPLVAAAREAMSDALKVVADSVLDSIERDKTLGTFLHRETAEQQIRDLMEFDWACVPCPDEQGEAYAAARRRADELLGSCKNTRSWAGVTWGGSAPKSAADGLRESVIDEELFRRAGSGEAGFGWERVRRTYGIRPSERLCGVGLLKRCGEQVSSDSRDVPPVFHSTSHVAAAPLFSHFARREEVRHAFDTYLDLLVELADGDQQALKPLQLRRGDGPIGQRHSQPMDGYVLHEGRVRDLVRSFLPLSSSQTRRAEQEVSRALRRLLRVIGHPPCAYYALVLADGDRMGALIDAQSGLAQHRQLSQALDEFATSTQTIVEQHGGSLIYAGGDDVLALLPLHRAVACSRRLAQAFSRAMAPFQGESPHPPSLSVGVAVAHHLTHFREVREQAKRAERLAKRERDSLALIVDKRSGPTRSVVGSWHGELSLPPLDERLGLWGTLLADDEVSKNLIHELHDLARLLTRDSAATEGQIVVAEMLRIVTRKQPLATQERGIEADVQQTLSGFVQAQWNGGAVEGVARLASELYVGHELQKAAKIVHVAGGGSQ